MIAKVSNSQSRAPGAEISISVNGREVLTRARTLADLTIEQGHATVRIATSVNGTFIPTDARPARELRGGDRIEIVSARQGG